MKSFIVMLLCCFCLSLSAATVNLTSSNLPIMLINTYGNAIPDDPKVPAHLGIINNEAGQRNHITDSYNEYDGMIGIELRGNSSIGTNWPKKGYGIETRKSNGENNNVPLFGMPRENDWTLHGPLMDKSLMRNALMYQLYRDMGNYAPRTQFVELVINGDYKGVYLLTEKIKVDANRVDISEPSSEDSTGGYLLEMTTSAEGRISPDDNIFITRQSFKPVEILYPKTNAISSDQTAYITDYFNDFEQALYDNDFKDPNSGYRAYIDLDSWIDHMLLSEAFSQLDVFRASQFFYKDQGTKLYLGPPWDFNRCIGNAIYSNVWSTENFWLLGQWNQKVNYYSRFSQDEAFMDQYKARWKELRLSIFSFDHIFSLMDNYASLLDEAKDRDFTRWPNYQRCHNVYVCNSGFDQELVYIKNWITEKFLWMDSQFNITFPPIINEINYQSATMQDAGDWVEIYNPMDSVLYVAGWKFLHDDTTQLFTLPAGTTIPSQGYLILCEDTVKFKTLFPDVTNYIGNLQFALSDTGGACLLQNASCDVVDSVHYKSSAPWPSQPAGSGSTLELIDPSTDNALAIHWQVGFSTGGTPGEANIRPLVTDLIINELMALNNTSHADEKGEYDDWIEIHNTGTEPINIGGLYITDKSAIPTLWRIPDHTPDSTTIPAGGYLVLWADEDPEQGVLHLGIRLNNASEQVGLVQKQGHQNLFLDLVKFPRQVADISYGCDPADSSAWNYMDTPTPGAFNILPAEPLAPVLIKQLPDKKVEQNAAYCSIATDLETYFLSLEDQLPIEFSASYDQGLDSLAIRQHNNKWRLTAYPIAGFSGDVQLIITGKTGTSPETQDTLTLSVQALGSMEFSTIDYYGDIRNYYQFTPARWEIADLEGSRRYYLKSTEYQSLTGYRLGEWSLVQDRSYADFTLTCLARTGEDLSSNNAADYAIVFGYQDPHNYCYALFNSSNCSACNGVFAVANGIRQTLETSEIAAFYDTTFHEIQIERTGNLIQIEFDGVNLLSADDPKLGHAGHVGVGSLNDAVYFDELDITGNYTPMTAVDPVQSSLPETYSLLQNYPNPFNNSTRIRFAVPQRAKVVMNVFGATGKKVCTLVNEVLEAGEHSVSWNGMDGLNQPVSSGIYIYKIQSNNFLQSFKMALIK